MDKQIDKVVVNAEDRAILLELCPKLAEVVDLELASFVKFTYDLQNFFWIHRIGDECDKMAIILAGLECSPYQNTYHFFMNAGLKLLSADDLLKQLRTYWFNGIEQPVLFRRLEFMNRYQRVNENDLNYIISIMNIGNMCEFGTALKSMVTKRFFTGRFALDPPINREIEAEEIDDKIRYVMDMQIEIIEV